MTSLQPYFIRALIDWIVDNDCTPYAVIDCTVEGAERFAEYATDGKLVLNLSARATRGLLVDDDALSVDCRFHGRAVHVSVPVGAVSTVYARENGMGVLLDVEKMSPAQPVAAKPPQPRPKAKPPTLKVVK